MTLLRKLGRYFFFLKKTLSISLFNNIMTFYTKSWINLANQLGKTWECERGRLEQ